MENPLEKNKQLVREFLQAMFELRIDTVRELMAEDCMFKIPNIAMRPDTMVGGEMLGFLEKLKQALPDGFEVTFIEQTAEDNRVSTMAQALAKTCDNTDYNNQYHFLHVIENGKIIKQYEYIDSLLATKVMGPIMKRLA